jgi:hypothetical protein
LQKIDPKTKHIHKYKHDNRYIYVYAYMGVYIHIYVYVYTYTERENMVVIVGLFEGLGEEKEEKRMNNMEIHFICVGGGHNETH